MIFSAKYPPKRNPGILLALFGFVLIQAGAGQAMAGNTGNFTRKYELSNSPRAMNVTGPYGQTANPIRLKKRKYPAVGGSYLPGRKLASENTRTTPNQKNRTPPSEHRGGNRGGGGSSIGVTIDVGRIIQQLQKPPPPRKVYPKPKRRKNTSTARRRPPRKQVRPPVLKTIPQFIPNEILVFVATDQAAAVGAELAAAFNLTVVETVPVALLEGSIIRFRYPDNRPLRDVIASLTSDPRVSQAQPNNYYHPVVKKRKKRSKKSNAQYSLAKLGVGPAHEISKGRDVRVAVIDTGIDARHPVLSKAIIQSFDAVGDGKKTVDRHGTAIAGLIAGQGKVKGVAPLSKLMAVRAFTMHREYNKPMTSGMILLRAFDWSFANKARVFNMSFSGPFDPLVKKALESAYEKGVILVAAAGNGGPRAAPAYPAAYKNVIAITALDNKDKLYAHANRGSYLTAAAPGVDMLVPSVKKGYRYSSGTSLAAAQISGLVALLLERSPDATSEAIVDAIKNSARDLGPKGHDIEFGAGLADAHATLLSLTNGQ
ncbi:MAG: S8 family peptidase [Alphaproteobacteria bacterium]